MKAKLVIILSLLLLSFFDTVKADDFTRLWHQVDDAERKDLPKTEIETLDKIIKKATKENAF